MTSRSGNPIVARFRLKLETRVLENLVRLYGYGVFYLVRSFEGRLSWTTIPPPADFEESVYYWEIVAATDV